MPNSKRMRVYDTATLTNQWQQVWDSPFETGYVAGFVREDVFVRVNTTPTLVGVPVSLDYSTYDEQYTEGSHDTITLHFLVPEYLDLGQYIEYVSILVSVSVYTPWAGWTPENDDRVMTSSGVVLNPRMGTNYWGDGYYELFHAFGFGVIPNPGVGGVSVDVEIGPNNGTGMYERHWTALTGATLYYHVNTIQQPSVEILIGPDGERTDQLPFTDATSDGISISEPIDLIWDYNPWVNTSPDCLTWVAISPLEGGGEG